MIQVGTPGTACTVTDAGTGGVTIDLGQLPGLGSLATVAGGDIKITIDAITSNAYQNGTDPAVLHGNVAGVHVQLGAGAPISVVTTNTPNSDLLGQVLGALAPSLGVLGTAVSKLIKGVLSLTTNYQPAPEPDTSGTSSVTGLHLTLLGSVGTVDLAKSTVGPNVPTAVGDAFSFQNLPIILGGLALLVLLGYGVRIGTRRVRGLA